MAHRIPEARVPVAVLRVLPRGTARVQDFRALMETGTNRFVGWKFDRALGPEFVDPKDKQTKRHGGRVKQVDAVVEIAADDPFRTEYLKALRSGDLWAADEATAREARVPFEPCFLGEHPKTSSALGVDPMSNADVAAMAKADPAPLFDADFKPKASAAPAKKTAAPAPTTSATK